MIYIQNNARQVKIVVSLFIQYSLRPKLLWIFDMIGNLQLKQAISWGIIYGIFGAFGLVAFLIIVLALSQYIPIIISVDENTSGLANISATIILAFLTAIYVLLTSQIVAQSAADRKVRFIERKLEKLYYPLRTALKRFDIDYVSNNIEQMMDPVVKVGEESPSSNLKNVIDSLWHFKKDFDQISPYLYMASNELDDSVMKIIHLAESNKLFVEKWEVLNPTEKYDKAYTLMNDDTIAELGSKVDLIVDWYRQSLEVIAEDIATNKKELSKSVE